MKKLSLFMIGACFILTSCGGSGGGAGGGTSPAPTTPTATQAVFKASPEGYFFGFIPLSTPVAKIITLTNIGTATSKPISLSGLPGSIVLSNNTCSGVSLAVNASCSFTVSMTITSVNSQGIGQSTGPLNIAATGSTTLALKFAGLSTDYVTSIQDNLVLPLLVNQDSDGSWTSEGLAFDMGATLFAAHSLVKSKIKAGYSQDLFSGVGDLSKTINYFQRTDDDGNGIAGEATDSDLTLRNINFVSDRDTIIPEWLRTIPAGGMKLKEIIPVYPLVLESITQLKNSTNSNIFTESDNFLSSRRMTATDGSMMAQYAYILDKNRLIADYGSVYYNNSIGEITESALRDIYVLFDKLLANNKTAEVQELSKAILLNFLSDSDAIFNETGVVMKYSTNEFNHTVFSSANLDEALFVKNTTCRMSAYVLLLAGLALENANYSEMTMLLGDANLKEAYSNSTKDILWTSFRTNYLDANANVDATEKANCIPLAALAAARSSRSIVSSYDVNSLYIDLVRNTNDFAYDGAQSSISVLSEAIEAMSQIINP